MAGMQVYLERFGAPARERLRHLVQKAKASNPLAPVTVAAPNPFAGISLRRILAGESGLLNVRFMVAARLAEYLGAPAMAERGKRPLSPLVEAATVRAAAGEIAGQGVLGDVAHHPSLHQSLRGTFRDLARLDEPDLEILAGLSPLQAETVHLFRRFQERTKGYYHREEMAAAAAEGVYSGAAGAAVRDIGAVIFYLTADLSPAETVLARALASDGQCSLILGLTGDAEVDRPALTLAESFASTPADGTGTPEGGNEGLAGASSGDESGGGFLVDGIVSAPDVREEVRRAVRDILREAGEGTPFHRMAALYRQADPYAHQLRLELGLAGLPMAGPQPTTLKDSAAGRLLLGLVAVIEDDFGRSRLMQWLAETPVRNGPGGAVASAELLHWEALSRQAGVVRGMDQWRDRMGRSVAQAEERSKLSARQEEDSPARVRAMEEQAERVAKLVDFVEDLAARLPPGNGSSWSEFAEWGKGALEYYASNPGEWPEEQQSALGRVEEVLGQLPELDDVEPGTTLAGFLQTLDQALDVPAGRSGLTGSGVFVANLGAALGMEFDAVWILGMAEGAFPPRAVEDQLLPDAARRSLGNGKLPLRRTAALEEHRVYLAASAAAKRRYLSYARTDPGARRGQRPAPWLLDAAAVRQANGGLRQRVSSQELTQINAQWLSVIQSPEDALKDAAAGKASDQHEYDLVALAEWLRTGGRLNQHPLATAGPSIGHSLGRALALEQARGNRTLTEWDGYLGRAAQDSARLSGTLTRVVSPTRLESWSKCPFQFFLGNVLSLTAWETPEDVLTISPLERGTLVHAVLERFINETLESGPPPGADAWGTAQALRIAVIAQEEFRKAEDRGVTGRRILWEAAKEEILGDLQVFLEKDADRRAEHGVQPWRTEFSFGFDGPPVTLDLPDGAQVSFRGFIDRVDVDPNRSRAMVVDYKTGSANPYKDMSDDPLGGGAHLQLPVYALAVRNALLPDAMVEAEYWFVSTRGGFQRVPVQLAEVETDFRATVQTIVQGIRNGVFPANPGSPGQNGPVNCAYCDFDRVCPANRQMLWERKQNSPQALPYVTLTRGSGDDGDDKGEA